MFGARAVLDEMASQIRYFTAASGAIPPTGVDLKITQLAAT